MKVPFVNYGLQYKNLKEEIDKAFLRVLEGGDLILREDVDKFEKNLADFVGTKHAVSLNSGTDALFFSLKILGIGQGDEVITVSHTFVASISVIVQAGAKPILVDVKEDYLIDEEKIEEAITEKTKAIIPVHYNGRMCNMDKITEIAQKHDLYIIEDAAQGLGSSFRGKKAGSVGSTGCFSFYPAKILGCFGDGGALTTNSDEIAKEAKLLRDHGQKTKKEIIKFGWNSRLDNLQAAGLNVKIKYLPDWLKRRRQIAENYNKRLSGVEGIKLPPDSDKDHYDVFQNYVLRAEKRNELYEFLKERGVETLMKDPVANHKQDGLNLFHFKLPLTEKLADEVISLPMYPELEDGQVDYVIKAVKDFYES